MNDRRLDDDDDDDDDAFICASLSFAFARPRFCTVIFKKRVVTVMTTITITCFEKSEVELLEYRYRYGHGYRYGHRYRC